MTGAAMLVKHEPRLVGMPTQKMAVVHTVGDPNELMPLIMPALYGAVYKLKFGLKKKGREFKVGPLRARWPDAHLVPRDQWYGIWGLPVPIDTVTLPQKEPKVEVDLEVWVYGMTAEILHIGPYSEEKPTIDALHEFITRNGYEIAGAHEEEYLTPPDAKVQKTIIRYSIQKARPVTALGPAQERALADILGPQFWADVHVP